MKCTKHRYIVLRKGEMKKSGENKKYGKTYEEFLGCVHCGDIKTIIHTQNFVLLKAVSEIIKENKKQDAHDYCIDSQDGCDLCANGIYNLALSDILFKLKR